MRHVRVLCRAAECRITIVDETPACNLEHSGPTLSTSRVSRNDREGTLPDTATEHRQQLPCVRLRPHGQDHHRSLRPPQHRSLPVSHPVSAVRWESVATSHCGPRVGTKTAARGILCTTANRSSGIWTKPRRSRAATGQPRGGRASPKEATQGGGVCVNPVPVRGTRTSAAVSLPGRNRSVPD